MEQKTLVILNAQATGVDKKTDPFPHLDLFLAREFETGRVVVVVDSRARRSVANPSNWRQKNGDKTTSLKLKEKVTISLAKDSGGKTIFTWNGKPLPKNIIPPKPRLVQRAIQDLEKLGLKFVLVPGKIPQGIHPLLQRKLNAWRGGKARKLRIVYHGRSLAVPDPNAFHHPAINLNLSPHVFFCGLSSPTGGCDMWSSLLGLATAKIHGAMHRRLPSETEKPKRVDPETGAKLAQQSLEGIHILRDCTDPISLARATEFYGSRISDIKGSDGTARFPLLGDAVWSKFIKVTECPRDRQVIDDALTDMNVIGKEYSEFKTSWTRKGEAIDLTKRTDLTRLNPFQETGKLGKDPKLSGYGANKSVMFLVVGGKNMVFAPNSKIPRVAVFSHSLEATVADFATKWELKPSDAKLLFKGYDKSAPENTNQAWRELAIYRWIVTPSDKIYSSLETLEPSKIKQDYPRLRRFLRVPKSPDMFVAGPEKTGKKGKKTDKGKSASGGKKKSGEQVSVKLPLPLRMLRKIPGFSKNGADLSDEESDSSYSYNGLDLESLEGEEFEGNAEALESVAEFANSAEALESVAEFANSAEALEEEFSENAAGLDGESVYSESGNALENPEVFNESGNALEGSETAEFEKTALSGDLTQDLETLDKSAMYSEE